MVFKVNPSEMVVKGVFVMERGFMAEVTCPFSAVTFCSDGLVSNWSRSNFCPNFGFARTGGVVEPSVGPDQLLWSEELQHPLVGDSVVALLRHIINQIKLKIDC